MFRIRYKVFGNINELKTITAQEYDTDPGICGEIEISFGEHEIGWYPDADPCENDYGGEWLDYWFESLLKTLCCLKSGNSYAAFSVIEKYGVWLEFRKDGTDVVINVTDNETESLCSLFITDTDTAFRYVEPRNTKIPYKQFEAEISATAKQFWSELGTINSELHRASRLEKISNLIQQLK